MTWGIAVEASTVGGTVGQDGDSSYRRQLLIILPRVNNGSPVNVVLSENAYSDVELAHSGRISRKESPGDAIRPTGGFQGCRGDGSPCQGSEPYISHQVRTVGLCSEWC